GALDELALVVLHVEPGVHGEGGDQRAGGDQRHQPEQLLADRGALPQPAQRVHHSPPPSPLTSRASLSSLAESSKPSRRAACWLTSKPIFWSATKRLIITPCSAKPSVSPTVRTPCPAQAWSSESRCGF